MHLRSRFLLPNIQKKQRVFPIVGVLGARQVGKSTLLRDLIGKQANIPYFTLDRPAILQELKSRAESFILINTNEFTTPIILDEAHKAPVVFDVLKVLADERKKRGIVIVTGSVDFALASGVRETLTGRMGLCRLYPLTVAEISQQKLRTPLLKLSAASTKSTAPCTVSANEVDAWLTRGGMPAICQLSNIVERDALIEEWLQSVCYRDLPQLKGGKYDGALARSLFDLIAKYPESSESDFARILGEDTRRIKTHLRALEALFVIYRISPYRQAGGTGFDMFCLHDAAIAHYLGAEKRTLYFILVVNEILAQSEYAGSGKVSLFHYSTRGKTKLDLIFRLNEKATALVISDRDTASTNKIKSLQAIIKDRLFPKVLYLAPVTQSIEIQKGIQLLPYELVC